MASDILVKVGADVSQFSQAMAKANADLKKIGDGMSRMGRSLQRAGSSLTKYITAPAVAATSALTGITLVKGFGRLIGIDTARAKLSALGHDASTVELIMENALESVRGTAYGLDEAATAAASAVAAGVDPGKELAKYLSLIGDSAAIAGADFNEMASIFNKVQTAQRAYTGELNMLADRGIPIFQWLAEEAGKSAEDIREMASQGEISAEMFRTAIEKNIGGAAQAIGEESFAAAVRNIGADIARIGANFLDAGGEAGGFFSTVKPMLTELRGFLQSLEGSAAQLGAEFGKAFTKMIERLRELKSWYDGLSPSMQSLVKNTLLVSSVMLVGLGPALKVIGASFTLFFGYIPRIVGGLKTLSSSFVPLLKNIKDLRMAFLPFSGIVGVIIALGAAFIIAYQKVDWFRESINNAISGLADLLIPAIDALKTAFTAAFDAITEFFIDKVSIITSFWQENGAQITQAAQNVWGVVQTIITTVMPIIVSVIKAAWTVVQIVVMSVWENIKGVIDGALNIILGLIKTFSSLFTGDWRGVWEGVKQIFNGAVKLLWNTIQLLLWGRILKGAATFAKAFGSRISSLWNAIKALFIGAINAIRSVFTSGFNTMRNIANTTMGGIRSFISTAWKTIRSIVSSVVSAVVNTVRTGFRNVVNAIRSAISSAISAVRSLITRMIGAIKSGVSRFISLGKELVRGLIRGIKNMTASAIGAITGVVKGVINKAKSLLRIKSPSKVFEQIGKWTGEGLADGLVKTESVVEKASEGLAEAATPDVPEISLAYATPIGVRSNLSSAVRGTVDVRGREDMIAMAIGRLERRLTNLEVVMDARVVGRIVEPHVTESQERNKKIHSNFRG